MFHNQNQIFVMSKTNPIFEPLLHVLDPISLILNQNSNSNQPCPLSLTSLEDSFIMERGRNYNAYAELREKRLRMRCLMEVQGENFEIEPTKKVVKFHGGLEKDENFGIETRKLVAPIRKNVNFQGGFGYGRKGLLEQDENFEIESRKLVTSTRKEVRFQGGLGYGRKGYLEQGENFVIESQKVLASTTRKEVKYQGGLASGRKGSFVVAQSVPDFSAVLRKENRKPLNYLPPVMEMMTPPSKSSFSKENNEAVSSSRGSKSESAGEKKKKTVGGGGGRVLMGRKSYASIDELKNLSSATAIAINGESKGRVGGGNGRVLRKSISVHR